MTSLDRTNKTDMSFVREQAAGTFNMKRKMRNKRYSMLSKDPRDP